MRRVSISVLSAVLALAVMASCGSSSDSASTTTIDPVCAARDDLTAALNTLTDVEVSTGAADEIAEDLAEVRAQLDNLGDAVGDDVKPQVDELKSALDDLESSVKDLASSGLSGVSAVGTSLAAVGTAGTDVIDELQQSCS